MLLGRYSNSLVDGLVAKGEAKRINAPCGVLILLSKGGMTLYKSSREQNNRWLRLNDVAAREKFSIAGYEDANVGI
jgi:hypothetical protein